MKSDEQKPDGNEMSTAQAIAEMMSVWNRISASVRKKFPNADEDTVYEICELAMYRALLRFNQGN